MTKLCLAVARDKRCNVCNVASRDGYLLFRCDRPKVNNAVHSQEACNKIVCAEHSLTFTPLDSKARETHRTIKHICREHLEHLNANA